MPPGRSPEAARKRGDEPRPQGPHPLHRLDVPRRRPIVGENIATESRFHTDESKLYSRIAPIFKKHETVKHSAGEYVRGKVHTSTIEGYFSIFKRGMKGVYQHCSEKHLHRYLAEFDFRYSNRSGLGIEDGERAALAVKGASGKRLTYRQPH